MYAELVALLSALSFGITAIILKKGYKHGSPLASSLVVLAVNMLLLWTASLFFVPVKFFLTTAAVFFVIGGVLAQGVARTFRYASIDKIGPSRTYIIIGASPLFAALFAVTLLKESITFSLFVGTLLVIAGIALLSGKWRNGKWERKHLLIPFSAAVIYGFVATVQKTGLSITPHALVGATTAVTSAFLGLLAFSVATRKVRELRDWKALKYFVAAGVFNSIAFTLNFEAIRTGNITRVMPLVGTQPLFVTLFSFLFLK